MPNTTSEWIILLQITIIAFLFILLMLINSNEDVLYKIIGCRLIRKFPELTDHTMDPKQNNKDGSTVEI